METCKLFNLLYTMVYSKRHNFNENGKRRYVRISRDCLLIHFFVTHAYILLIFVQIKNIICGMYLFLSNIGTWKYQALHPRNGFS
jgi:hypothetical protein